MSSWNSPATEPFGTSPYPSEIMKLDPSRTWTASMPSSGGSSLADPGLWGSSPSSIEAMSLRRRSACSVSALLPMAFASSSALVSSSVACLRRRADLDPAAYFSRSSALTISWKISVGFMAFSSWRARS